MKQLDDLSDETIRSDDWYYKIELRPDVMTGGRVRGTSSMTRQIVRNIDLEGQRCLDIGMQEGLLSVLMARQGAANVSGYDRLNLTDRLALVQEAYDVSFDYYHSLELTDLADRLRAQDVPLFDVGVFAGVLYHMVDPLAGLAAARAHVREGGIMLLETSVTATGDYAAQFNAGGRFYGGSNYFQISLGCFDYFARMLRMKPIDLLFKAPSKDNISRVCIVCRVTDQAIPNEGDTWMDGPWVAQDFRVAGLDFANNRSDLAPVGYTPINPDLVYRKGTDCVDVWETFEASKPHRGKASEGELYLSDTE
ncbi:class I SAM-dependent methyltransferase [Maritimibacter dapengensis]|uniref:Methyltransferase domain-containing protein n=1 Tax=Maritimibacter dapengensis TaxID=2836868 RepID=A0ABS6T3T6_9RHOB|nr:methyltransferase domain-containing protein [Maritimibacter dapengensis]MBV7379909.1 methyltransferase domain-containing protein [Maritimibacter dapengensis]